MKSQSTSITVWKNAIECDHDFYEKNQHIFRQIIVFTKEITRELISRKIFECDTFPRCQCNEIKANNFRQITLLCSALQSSLYDIQIISWIRYLYEFSVKSILKGCNFEDFFNPTINKGILRRFDESFVICKKNVVITAVASSLIWRNLLKLSISFRSIATCNNFFWRSNFIYLDCYF